MVFQIETNQSNFIVNPETISCYILKKLKSDVENFLNGRKVTKAVIAVPHYFNNAQMVCGMIKLMLSKCGYDNDLMFYKLYKIIEKFPTINNHLKQSADDRNFDFIHLNDDDKKRIDDDINLMFRNNFIKS